MSVSEAPGWYGKIASLGDFASRRLPASLIANLDTWLQGVIHESRARLGESWLEAYLTGPVWRFLLFPGAAAPEGWAGVLMPSVDKVGRYFPLLIASRQEAFPDGAAGRALEDWLDRAEAIALATLADRATVEGFDQALQECRPPSAPPPPESPPLDALFTRSITANHLAPGASLSDALQGLGRTRLHRDAHGHSLWWAPQGSEGARVLITVPGLPDGATFATLLRGGPDRPESP